MKKMTCTELADSLFEHREKPVQIEFYAEFEPTTGEKSWAFRAITTDFVDSNIVLINYYGGGALFAYEFTDSDTDASGLRNCLETYFYTAALGDSVWVEGYGDSDRKGHWIENTPFSCACSVCGAERYGLTDDPADKRCPACHAAMIDKAAS